MTYLVNDYYPLDYFALPGVKQNPNPHERWWSSRERLAQEDGLPTVEYMEIDFGRPRSLNYVAFESVAKPINITLEHDSRSFADGSHKWVSLTPLRGEHYDARLEYVANSVNPWRTCEFYFTMVTTRWLRVRFERRSDPWPNATVPAFPWSIDVANLRTARYVVGLDDARGLLIDTSSVTKPLTP